MGAVHPIGGARKKGLSPRAARIRRLRERLAVEEDPRVRAMVVAQLRAFGRQVDGE